MYCVLRLLRHLRLCCATSSSLLLWRRRREQKRSSSIVARRAHAAHLFYYYVRDQHFNRVDNNNDNDDSISSNTCTVRSFEPVRSLPAPPQRRASCCPKTFGNTVSLINIGIPNACVPARPPPKQSGRVPHHKTETKPSSPFRTDA